MTASICKECKEVMPGNAKACANCGALVTARSPLVRLAYFYVVGGIAFIALYGYLVDPVTARSLAVSWLAVGLALALIIYGRAKRHASDTAALIYLAGLALLVIMLAVGVFLLWKQGAAIPLTREFLN